MKISIKQIVIGTALLAAGLFIGWVMFGGQSTDNHQHETLAEVWTCSMHPQVRQDQPGQCPFCGMDLIPLSSMEEDVASNEVQMTEAAMKMAEVRTVLVKNGPGEKLIYLPGKIAVNEKSLSKVPAHFNARVDKLYADFTGQYLRKGQRLATLYSPELVMAQKELFEAASMKAENPSYYEAAVQKLKLWDLTDQQIQKIVDQGEAQYQFDIIAPQSGTITVRNVTEGQHVKNGDILFEIMDLSTVWVNFDVYESDLKWIKKGQEIAFTIQSYPGETFKGAVSFIDPAINSSTRTATVRVDVNNRENRLKPEMFVEGMLNANMNSGNDQLVIPKTAVLWTGKRAVVYVKQPNYSQPTFQFREISLGSETGEHYVVIEGLKEGEEIVENGVFKIDASAQLQGKTSMMNPVIKEEEKTPFEGDGLGIVAPKQTDGILPKVNISDSEYDSEGEFKTQLETVYQSYLPIKNALVASDSDEASEAATLLLSNLEKVNMSLVKGEAHSVWMDDLNVLIASAEFIRSQNQVEEARKALSALSDQLFHSLKKFKTETGAYRQFCPMAFDNDGAFWLSDSDEILNPYFGDAMLTCGSIDQKLK